MSSNRDFGSPVDIEQVLQFLALWAAKLLFFSGCCLKTEVFKQLY
jgi:hypothetical protein